MLGFGGVSWACSLVFIYPMVFMFSYPLIISIYSLIDLFLIFIWEKLLDLERLCFLFRHCLNTKLWSSIHWDAAWKLCLASRFQGHSLMMISSPSSLLLVFEWPSFRSMLYILKCLCLLSFCSTFSYDAMDIHQLLKNVLNGSCFLLHRPVKQHIMIHSA